MLEFVGCFFTRWDCASWVMLGAGVSDRKLPAEPLWWRPLARHIRSRVGKHTPQIKGEQTVQTINDDLRCPTIKNANSAVNCTFKFLRPLIYVGGKLWSDRRHPT